ncbi:CHC2 zinc finger domain-containing protein [Bacillus cereus group sp. Bc011]|uniref:CHC2 zinc finger domain-containing protein n=1 Tax=unclassified Bacillus cereus group TaxID=2750818 RepID=UPI0022E33BD9|nr:MULTISPECIES: CHC2 zinc finger domain-containing protein [unclassified Bacillus cereus group]MDA2681065.1 CHC2 zinc finger domain-containing protein [Bacillus cereus group sp. Bc029]MDA2742037.1 CHC2 zinc finger domain-containing protein [Bacillus cereus group sp. Bc011]
MAFYERIFGELQPNSSDEAAVHCPWHEDSEASAHINIESRVFHCKACDLGLSETAFVQKHMGCSYGEALQYTKLFERTLTSDEKWTENMMNLMEDSKCQERLQQLGFTKEIQKQLQLGYTGSGWFSYPVFMRGHIVDIRTYSPKAKKKIMGKKGGMNVIYPYDLWKDDQVTILCAGEKDMAIARVFGFNSITFTGGESSFPDLFASSFYGKKIYIVYDNDGAGIDGAYKVAMHIKDAGGFPYVVTGHHEICVENHEDLHDFFMKYKKSRGDFIEILQQTKEFSEEDYRKERKKHIPQLKLLEAASGKYMSRIVSSHVQTISNYPDIYQIPTYLETTIETETGYTTKTWDLNDKNLEDLLLLCDNRITEANLFKSYCRLLRVSPKEAGYIKKSDYKRVFKAVVTDYQERMVVEEGEEDIKSVELPVYSLECPFEYNDICEITYKIAAHPLQAQRIVAVAKEKKTTDSGIHSFKINTSIIESLQCFQVSHEQTLQEKLAEMFEKAKTFIGLETNKKIWLAEELFFHTPLYFRLPAKGEIRGTIDMMIVGETRTGKSRTAKKLMEMYELGMFCSLRTTSQTAIIGGTDKNTNQIRVGLLPRNHEGAVILEEFSETGSEIIKNLTEVRSSQRARITRVNGHIDVPCNVRMLTLTNVKKDGTALRSYPNGVIVVKDLVGKDEDVARYDGFVLVDKPDEIIYASEDTKPNHYGKESYMNRARWVWTRKSDEIVWSEGTIDYLNECAHKLYDTFGDYHNFIGTEGRDKLARFAVATAGLVCSMDITGNQLVIKQEHINFAFHYIRKMYDNELFRLREYVNGQREYEEADQVSTQICQNLYVQATAVIQFLENHQEIYANQLQLISGMDQESFSKMFNTLQRAKLVRMIDNKFVPTMRFRKSMRKIEKGSQQMKPLEVL